MNNKSILTAYLIRTMNVCFSRSNCNRDCDYHDDSTSKCGVIIWRSWYVFDKYGPICDKFDKITCHNTDAACWNCGSGCIIQQRFTCKLTIMKKMLFKNKLMKP